MSFLTEVLRNAHDLSHAAQLVLLAITAYIDEHGTPVYPSQATLARDSGVTERYIEACVQECEGAGYLHVERHRLPGKRPRNFYTVVCRWRTIPEQASGNLVPRTDFIELPSVEKKEKREDLQEHSVRGNQFPEPGSGNQVQALDYLNDTPLVPPPVANADGKAWLRTMADELSPDFAQALQGTAPQGDESTNTPAQTAVPTDTIVRTPRKPRTRREPGTAPRRLGKLCPQGHDYEGSGQSMRRWPGGSCVECDREQQRARALTKNPNPRAHKPYAWQERPEVEPEILTGEDAARHREPRPYTLRLVKARQQG